MKPHCAFRFILIFGFALSLARPLAAQGAASVALVVNGKTIPSAVRQIDGRSYVDVQALAQAINGVVAEEPNRVVLTIPVSNPSAISNAAPPQNPQDLSKPFAVNAIAEVAEMREWRAATATMINYGLAVSGAWAQNYHDGAQNGLKQVELAASTDADRDALQLLRDQFDNLSAWTNDVFAARQNLNAAKTIDPNALSNDPTLAKITKCSHALEAMLISGAFSDDGSCH
jgi:hypothetical protein